MYRLLNSWSGITLLIQLFENIVRKKENKGGQQKYKDFKGIEMRK